MRVRLGIGWLLLTVTLLVPGTAAAQQSWPVDNAGVPAPPCTNYNPAANTVGYCTTAHGTVIVTRADVSVGAVPVAVCPINVGRVDCSCTLNTGAGNAIRVGDANVTASRGQQVSAGAAFREVSEAALFAIGEAAGPVTVSCTEQRR